LNEIIFSTINWRAYINSTSKETAMEIVKRIEEQLKCHVVIQSYERYWKDETEYEVTFTSPLDISHFPLAIYTSLKIANRLSYSWRVTGPSEYENGQCSFEGISTDTRIPGLNWICFNNSNH
jgi:hypothetical protein